MNLASAVENVKTALASLGLTPDGFRDSDQEYLEELDLERTPERVVKMWIELTESLRMEPPDIQVFESDHKQMMILRDIPFTSLCSHHLVPFRGKAHVGYIPNGKVIGISKPARVVDYYAARPQTQELLTSQIADYLMAALEPKGVMVILEAEHVCVSARGARKPGSRFVTSAITGVFETDPGAKVEFLGLLQVNG